MDSKKKFDAVEATREWRLSSSKRLAMMSREERLTYLNDNIDAKLEALSGQSNYTKERDVTFSDVSVGEIADINP